jgi:serine/threonine protein kinase
MAWAARHGIAVGTARGLEYLHKGCQRRIIHRDINSSNVLLTDDLQPQVRVCALCKQVGIHGHTTERGEEGSFLFFLSRRTWQISDFGLAKWLPSEWTHRAIAPIEGTFGCLAPEYYTHGIVDEKTDVFAFGVFLLELVAGRKPVDGSHRSLLSWVIKTDKQTFPPFTTTKENLQRTRISLSPTSALKPLVNSGPAAAERRQDRGPGGSQAGRRLRRRAGEAGRVRGVAVHPGVGDVAAVHD